MRIEHVLDLSHHGEIVWRGGPEFLCFAKILRRKFDYATA